MFRYGHRINRLPI